MFYKFAFYFIFFFHFFFFNDTATTEIYTLSLHDALPIFFIDEDVLAAHGVTDLEHYRVTPGDGEDRKSTRLNSSHDQISYAVFCLKKKKKKHHSFPLKQKKIKKNKSR